MPDGYRSFADFHPYYLAEHSKRTTRRLHFAGTLLIILTLVYALATDMLTGRIPF